MLIFLPRVPAAEVPVIASLNYRDMVQANSRPWTVTIPEAKGDSRLKFVGKRETSLPPSWLHFQLRETNHQTHYQNDTE